MPYMSTDERTPIVSRPPRGDRGIGDVLLQMAMRHKTRKREEEKLAAEQLGKRLEGLSGPELERAIAAVTQSDPRMARYLRGHSVPIPETPMQEAQRGIGSRFRDAQPQQGVFTGNPLLDNLIFSMIQPKGQQPNAVFSRDMVFRHGFDPANELPPDYLKALQIEADMQLGATEGQRSKDKRYTTDTQAGEAKRRTEAYAAGLQSRITAEAPERASRIAENQARTALANARRQQIFDTATRLSPADKLKLDGLVKERDMLEREITQAQLRGGKPEMRASGTMIADKMLRLTSVKNAINMISSSVGVQPVEESEADRPSVPSEPVPEPPPNDEITMPAEEPRRPSALKRVSMSDVAAYAEEQGVSLEEAVKAFAEDGYEVAR